MVKKITEAVEKTHEACLNGAKKSVYEVGSLTVQTYWCGTVLRTDVKGLTPPS